ncbi:MAG: histone deacetylase family protein [Aminobacterium sp.]|nr:histone deacetylase family protein [Aminobacterium sp.]MDD4551949.1 histone deacetylase family protein [Aminobacterium sp.]
MFRIRRIYDNTLLINKEALIQIQAILRQQFPGLTSEEIEALPFRIRDQLKYGFQTILFVAEGAHRKVQGFALTLVDPLLHFMYLDYLAAAKLTTGRGIGGALYERIRQEALLLECRGIFFECLPDDPAISRNPEIRKENRARLHFYEYFGTRPIIGTRYETPLKEGGDNPPYLVFDDLGQNRPLSKGLARRIVRTILEKKYKGICPPEYISMVVNSFNDDPIRLRPFVYIKEAQASLPVRNIPDDEKIALLMNKEHIIHHVHERGYVESPVRIGRILSHLEKSGLFKEERLRPIPDSWLRNIHDGDFLDYLKKVCTSIGKNPSVYPYVFPIRNATRPPKELVIRAGYYCIDTFTPLNGPAWQAARQAINCAITGAKLLEEGHHLAYALIRPPGHHSERRAFGGFCYLNSTAAAAQYLSHRGTVAILDIDYHHGNGQQNIFYKRNDVLTISIHGHPSFAYPYFSGFEDEKGEGEGKGYNVNIPLSENIDGEKYGEALHRALKIIRRFSPSFLVVALGFDTAQKDPTGSWNLTAKDFYANGRDIGKEKYPTLVVQEGGYDTKRIGINARSFFTGLWEGTFFR